MRVPFSGGCACGAIRYECSASPLGMGHCHCRDCQRSSGTGHSSVLVVPAAAVAVTGTPPRSHETRADDGDTVRRGFCPECGSPLFASSGAHPEFLSIKAASLDDPGSFRPTIDAWTSSAQPWDSMSPETLKFEKDIGA